MENIDNIVCKLSKTFYNQEGHIVFDPPLYIQRYNATISCINHKFFNKQIRHIVEYGCAEMKFFNFIKCALVDRKLSIKLVDIDSELLMRCRNNIQPLIMDHIKRREHDLYVEMWQGDISLTNPNFKDVDAVVAIEVIEHVQPHVLNEIPFQIFENLKPKVVVFTTPNCEYNEIFGLKPGNFRHDDHKFEWNRQQFQDWCENICERYPEYALKIEGVGEPPDGFDINKIGCSSQLGLFVRKDFMESLQEPSNAHQDENQIVLPPKSTIISDGYHLLTRIDYPVHEDSRTEIEKINDEICYHVNRLKFLDQYYNDGTDRIEIPIKSVIQACWEVTTNECKIDGAIRQRFKVVNDLIVIENDYNNYDDSNEPEDYDDSNEPEDYDYNEEPAPYDEYEAEGLF